ncbi:MAG: APC family permease [Armatimonadetes bacterium]|nr:APC family permease [Armatimonadota bacterium]
MSNEAKPLLKRDLTLAPVVATAVCTVIGGGINVLTVEIFDAVPGIDGLVPMAFFLGALPAAVTALAYASLSSAMPRAGGGYVYISRGLNPYLGFIATFSKWWGFSTACGVVAYLDVALLRAAASYAGLQGIAERLQTDAARLGVPLAMVWLFWLANLLGVRVYGQTVVVLMALMLSGGAVLVAAGALADHNSFAQAMLARHGVNIHEVMSRYRPPAGLGSLRALIQATIILFFAYIGFESASQAGGEARDAQRMLPRALVLSLVIITGYYLLLSWALYHAVPWRFVAQMVAEQKAELSIPELMGVLLPKSLAVYVSLMAAIALANDVPPMLMAASRLFFAWANDGVFPRRWAAVHPVFRTPHIALSAAAFFATCGVVGCHFFGPVAMGVDSVVLALLLTYMCASLALVTLPWRNQELHKRIAFIGSRPAQVIIGATAAATSAAMLLLQLKDAFAKLAGKAAEAVANGQSIGSAIAHNAISCPAVPWLTMLLAGSIIFAASWSAAARAGVDLAGVFSSLPREGDAERGDDSLA